MFSNRRTYAVQGGKADYLGHDGFVDLEILLDGPRYDIQTIEGDTERNLLDMAFQVADEFRWPFGEKRLIYAV